MRIAQRPDDPLTWELHDLAPEDREALARFLATHGDGAVVDPYSPVLVRFGTAASGEAFARAFAAQVG